jgi:hypothetical protein
MVGLGGVEHLVVTQDRQLLDRGLAGLQVTLLEFGLLPEHRQGGPFSLADLAAQRADLTVGAPERRVVAFLGRGQGEQEYIHTPVGLPSTHGPWSSGGGLPRLTPGNRATL